MSCGATRRLAGIRLRRRGLGAGDLGLWAWGLGYAAKIAPSTKLTACASLNQGNTSKHRAGCCLRPFASSMAEPSTQVPTPSPFRTSADGQLRQPHETRTELELTEPHCRAVEIGPRTLTVLVRFTARIEFTADLALIVMALWQRSRRCCGAAADLGRLAS